jgi:hypothetical protein
MSKLPGQTRDVFDGRAVYRICVQGRIAAISADRLPDMEVTVVPLEDGGAVSTLIGEVRDQAALAGVLNTLYEWHLPVLSLQRLSARPASREGP